MEHSQEDFVLNGPVPVAPENFGFLVFSPRSDAVGPASYFWLILIARFKIGRTEEFCLHLN